VITIPYWVNLLIRTVSLKFPIRNTGPQNEVLIDHPLPLANTNLVVQLGLFCSYLPFKVLPIHAAVERHLALSEAAADLYASRLATLRAIVLPVVRPASLRAAS